MKNLRLRWMAVAAGLLTVGPLSPAFAVQKEKVTTATADQASNNESDITLMKEIRQAIQRDDLSVKAENVQIIANGGKVTLKGDVETSKEKQVIGAEAEKIAGQGNIDNDITVKGK